MSRRRSLLTLLALALAGLAAATTGGADEPGPAEPKAHAQAAVVDLDQVATELEKKRDQHPAENVSKDDLASIEQQIRSRSSSSESGPEEGISPGAPTDEEVRQELRELRRAQRGAAGGPITRGSGGLVQPSSGQFTSPFGQRWGRLHAGIDIAAPIGTPIYAAAAGRVILMGPTGGYGNYTCLDHGSSVSTCYGHQSRFVAELGEVVQQGEVIGLVGNTGRSTGPHLHFEVRIDGRPVDPMDYL
jgi:murein DD-endopeptidase MepM/ murein hydrolase activator NlpD